MNINRDNELEIINCQFVAVHSDNAISRYIVMQQRVHYVCARIKTEPLKFERVCLRCVRRAQRNIGDDSGDRSNRESR